MFKYRLKQIIDKHLPDIAMYSFFITAVLLLIFVDTRSNIFPYVMADENIYKDIITNYWSYEGLRTIYGSFETKPPLFLLIWKLTNADIVLTRSINLMLVLINTYLIYSITNSKKAIFYPIIIVFCNSMWLTAETIEVFFLLLGFKYSQRIGLFIALGALFRPYIAFYSIFLNKKNWMYIFLVGGLFSVWMLYVDLFFPYLFGLIDYSGSPLNDNDYLALFMLIPLFMASSKNVDMQRYAVISLLPLFIRLYGHYFIVPYTLLFLGYLMPYGNIYKNGMFIRKFEILGENQWFKTLRANLCNKNM